ncbi:MAG: hypothetical protein O3B31_15100, partial [Chloroflexi bacterium]|nr:hypothetical protein [Chloroflexota bacterium]
ASLVAGLALLRVALTPLSVAGRDAIDARAALTLAIGLGALAVLAIGVWRSHAERTEAPDPLSAR